MSLLQVGRVGERDRQWSLIKGVRSPRHAIYSPVSSKRRRAHIYLLRTMPTPKMRLRLLHTNSKWWAENLRILSIRIEELSLQVAHGRAFAYLLLVYIKLVHMARIVFGWYKEESCGHGPLWSEKGHGYGGAEEPSMPPRRITWASELKDHKNILSFRLRSAWLL